MIQVIEFKLKEALEKKTNLKGKTYREIAEHLDIDHVSLWKMLNGKPYNPSFGMLDRLCSKLGAQPGEILRYTKDKHK